MLPLPAGGGKGRKQLPGEGIGGARGLALKRKAAKEKEKARGGKRRRDESGNAEVPAPLRRPSTRSYARAHTHAINAPSRTQHSDSQQ